MKKNSPYIQGVIAAWEGKPQPPAPPPATSADRWAATDSALGLTEDTGDTTAPKEAGPYVAAVTKVWNEGLTPAPASAPVSLTPKFDEVEKRARSILDELHRTIVPNYRQEKPKLLPAQVRDAALEKMRELARPEILEWCPVNPLDGSTPSDIEQVLLHPDRDFRREAYEAVRSGLDAVDSIRFAQAVIEYEDAWDIEQKEKKANP